jgi:hypothetical protein
LELFKNLKAHQISESGNDYKLEKNTENSFALNYLPGDVLFSFTFHSILSEKLESILGHPVSVVQYERKGTLLIHDRTEFHSYIEHKNEIISISLVFMRYNRIVEEDYFVIRKFNKEFAAIILSSSDYEEIEKLESVKKIKENMRNLLMELPEYRLLNLTGTLQ